MKSKSLPPSAGAPARDTELPRISDAQKSLVQQTFAEVAPMGDQAVALFYDRLFEIDPDLRIMFKEDMTEQRRKLLDALELAVEGLDVPDLLVPVVGELGRRHRTYGISDADYAAWRQARIASLGPRIGAHLETAARLPGTFVAAADTQTSDVPIETLGSIDWQQDAVLYAGRLERVGR